MEVNTDADDVSIAYLAQCIGRRIRVVSMKNLDTWKDLYTFSELITRCSFGTLRVESLKLGDEAG